MDIVLQVENAIFNRFWDICHAAGAFRLIFGIIRE